MNNVGHVRNPLTIIAIFSGITEVSGAAVLPFLSPESQSIFVWFLVTFPFVLVLLFFVTLNFNHKVLYAPSDYADEENFMRWFGRASPEERVNKLNEEAAESEEDAESAPGKSDESEKGSKPAAEIAGDGAPQAGRSANIHKLKKANAAHGRYLLAEELVIRALGEKSGLSFQRDMVLRAGNRRLMFDAVAESRDNKLIGVEIKFTRNPKILGNTAMKWVKQLADSYASANKQLRQRLQFVLVVVVEREDQLQEAQQRLEEKLRHSEVPVQLEVFDMPSLESRYL